VAPAARPDPDVSEAPDTGAAGDAPG
jgi:hypothetical protein